MLMVTNNFLVTRWRNVKRDEADTIISQQLYHNERYRKGCCSKWHYSLNHICTFHTQYWADKSGYDDVSNSQLHCIDIHAMYESTRRILCIPSLLAPHRLTGCNTAATYFGIGKGMKLKLICAGLYTLHKQTSSKHKLPSTVLQFSLLCPDEVQAIGKHWQLLQSKSHCLQTTSLSMKT